MASTKHFNRGNVWGRVVEAVAKKKGKTTPYLQLKIDCSSDRYGKVKTFGRIWGADRIKTFMELYRAHKTEIIRFTGFLQQYRTEDAKTYNNYTFYEWKTAEGKEPRAAFIIVGDVTQKGTMLGEGRLVVDLLRSGPDEDVPVEEHFELWTAGASEIAEVEEGRTYELKGMIRPKEAEDEFGGRSGHIRAYVMAIQRRGEGENT